MYTDQVQSGYASDRLFIGNLCFAKLSVVLLLWTLSPVRLHRRMALALGLAIIFWAEFVAAFQCSTPESWRLIGNKCINQVRPLVSKLSNVYVIADRMQNAFWTYFGILNIITDAAFTLSPSSCISTARLARRTSHTASGLWFCATSSCRTPASSPPACHTSSLSSKALSPA